MAKTLKIEFFRNTAKQRSRKNLRSVFDINFSYFGQKRSKKEGADMVLASAVKWAEMAADYENGQNSKKIFCPV